MRISILFLCVLLHGTHQQEVVVRKSPKWEILGKKIHVEGRNVEIFLGIPYAEPPIGPLRYSKPKLLTRFPAKLEAFAYSPSCHQIRLPVQDHVVDDKGVFEHEEMEEDCLYLNIWTPSEDSPVNNGDGKAVMVWIHGGGFLFGSGGYLYDGSLLASLGDVVVVTLNYRLGSFGFLTGDIEDAPGNMGLYDQNVALQWIQQNIDYFGGDPDKVTIFGESAGGISVGAHLTSRLSKGLFRRAILQSGTPNIPFWVNYKSRVLNFTDQFASIVGCRDEDQSIVTHADKIITCLRSKPAKELAHADYLLLKNSKVYTQFFPILEETFLNYQSHAPFKPSYVNDYDIMIGVNKDEMASLFFLTFPEMYIPGRPKLSKSETIKILNDFFRHTLEVSDPENYIKPYFEEVSEANATEVNIKMSDLMSAWAFICPSKVLSDIHSARGNQVYFYFLSYPTSNVYFQLMYDEWPGAFHFDEIQYIFGFPLAFKELNYTDAEKELSREMIKLWTSFAKDGTPNSELYYYWPPYPKILELHAEYIRVLDRLPQDKLCREVWEPLLEPSHFCSTGPKTSHVWGKSSQGERQDSCSS